MNIYRVFILLFLLVGLVPNFYAVDVIATQWLYLAFVNTLFFCFLIFKKAFNFFDKNLFFQKDFFLFSIVLILSIFSIYNSVNKIESLLVLSRFFILLLSIVSFYFIFKLDDSNINQKVNFLFTCFFIYLFAEVFFIALQFYVYFDIGNGLKTINRSASFAGFAANINIASFSIVYKLPFVFYILLSKKSRLLNVISYIAISLSTFFIVYFGSRGALLSLFFILFIFSCVVFYKAFNKLTLFKIVFLVLATFILSNTFVFTKESNLNVLNRVQTFNDDSVNERLRFFDAAFNQMKSTPFLGVGIGNWKLVSIDYEKQHIFGYKVPYVVHNDFLQMGAEIGIIGFLAYLFFFTIPIVICLRSIFSLEKSFNVILTYSIILFSLLAIFFDSSLNFPITRPMIIIPTLMLFSFTYNLNSNI